MEITHADNESLHRLRVCVIVASICRGEEIGQLLDHLSFQTRPPSSIILSVECQRDLPEKLDPHIEIVMGPRGLTAQRNRGLTRAIGQSDIIVFFDDDFVPCRDALENIAELFKYNDDIVGATGTVLRDGVKHGGLAHVEAVKIVSENDISKTHEVVNLATDYLYGCNMAIRTSAIGNLRFDEKLPLYAWQEDVDFAGQLMAKGRIVKTSAFAGVHRGVNKGRSPGVPLGFSQIVNPVYLVRKGTMRSEKAIQLMLKNFLANHAKMFRSESFIDRMGRSKGNWIGLWHIVQGKCDPTKILNLH